MADAAGPVDGVEPTTTDRWRWVRRLGPWVISAAAVIAILLRYPLDRIVAEMGRGNVPAMIPAAIAGAAALWFTATLGDLVLLRRLVVTVRFWDLFRGKAGVAVLNALGMAANYGGHALWIQRRFGVRPATAVGMLMMVTVLDLSAVSLLATVAVWVGGDALPVEGRERLRLLAPAVAVVALTLVLLPARGGHRPLFEPWRAIPARNRLASVAARMGNIAILIVATWVAARGFGLPIPFGVMAMYLPILLVVGAMPINIGGFGAVQAAWVALLAPWASGERILAFQFLWHLILFVALFLRGAPFLRRVVADVAAGRRAAGPPAGPGPTSARSGVE